MAYGGAFAYTIKGVLLGHDEDGDPVTSGILEPCEVPEAAPKAPRLTGADQVALEALSDALAHHGKAMAGDMFPAGRLCVSLEIWREMCDRHSLTAGDSPTSRRTAFHKVKTRLQEKHMVRIVDGFVWRVADNDDRSHRSQAVPGTLGTGGVPSVPIVPPSIEGGTMGTLGAPCTPARHNPSQSPPVTLTNGQPKPTHRPRPDWCPEMPRPLPSTSLFLASTLPSAGCLTAAAGGCGGAVVPADLIGSRADRHRQPGKNPRFFCGGTPCGGPFPAFTCMCMAFQTALYLYFRGSAKQRFPRQMLGGRVLRNLKWRKTACALPHEIPPEERAADACDIRGNAAPKGSTMQSPAKLTVDLDANTAARLEVERARIAAETGLPRVSLAGTVAAVLRRALPDAEATTTRRPKSQEARA